MKVFILVVAVMVCSIAGMEEEQGCICTLEFNPVCSTENEMFPNLCSLLCNGEAEVDLNRYYDFQSGKCRKFCICPYIWNPVCTSDNVMYANICMLECEGDLEVDETKRYDAVIGACVPVPEEEPTEPEFDD